MCHTDKSLPVRECGLKSVTTMVVWAAGEVTPRAGVWIEICALYMETISPSMSLPLRECGLKYADKNIFMLFLWSLPVRECGLK